MTDFAARMNCGIYQIRHIESGKIYIGSSKDIKRRFYLHRWALDGGRHHSITLQRAWNKYGRDAFEFTRILGCSEQHLDMYEQMILDRLTPFDPAIGFNICSDVRGGRGHKWTEEQRSKFIAYRTGRSIFKNNPVAHANMMAAVRRGSEHPMFGKRHSDESRKKMSESLMGREAPNKGLPSPFRGKKKPPSVGRAISVAKKGKPWSEARRAAENKRKSGE